MPMKKLSHVHKTLKQRQGSAFAVLGYPRSGTTMLSEVVGMVTDYYFDRDNAFPSSSRVVLHTHWNPAWYVPARAVCILRDPIDVHLSLRDYAGAQGWTPPADDALRSRRFAPLGWADHARRAQAAGHLVIDYGALVAGDAGQAARLGEHLGVPADWIDRAMALLSAKHAAQPHASDDAFRAAKTRRHPDEVASLRARLDEVLAEERALHRELCPAP